MEVNISGNTVRLTPTEVKLMDHIIHGQTDQQIALARRVSVGTVRQQIKSLLSKTTMGNKLRLAVWAVLFGGFGDKVDLEKLVA